jgi:hypothetical protein
MSRGNHRNELAPDSHNNHRGRFTPFSPTEDS